MLKKTLVVLSVVLILTMLSMGTGIALANDSETTRHPTVTSNVDSSIIKRLLALEDEATLDAALTRLVANGALTDRQAVRIKGAWLKNN